MALTFHFDDDATLEPLTGQTIAILGYGNQGRAQALNLRDNGCTVIIGNRDDDYADRAREDGFDVHSIADAAAAGDVLLILTTDESQPALWASEIAPGLEPGNALVWASGYNVGFGLIEPPTDVDVVLVAPRMVGSEVRTRFQRGGGHLAAIGVHQDATGTARDRMLAIAKGIGATRGGAFECTFRAEAEADLFMEQVVLPGVTAWFETCFALATEHGYDPEFLVLEMYASGEMSEVFQLTAVDGFYRSMLRHSTTARYGELSNLGAMFNDELRERARRTLVEEIQGGNFARRWTTEQSTGAAQLSELWQRALDSPISQAEERVVPLLRDRVWNAH